MSLTTNPLFLLWLSAATIVVVLWRRTDAPWARSLGMYLTLALVVIAIRMVFVVALGGARGATVLFTLPSIPLPDWAAGIQLGGPVMAEAVLGALYDSLRLAAMLLCVGAANALANPRKALRSVPAALYELSVAVTIGLTLAPQLVESVQRVRRARRLRGGASTGWSAVRGVVIPVLEDAIERSLALAQGMEVRGFGRTRTGSIRRATTALLLLGAMAATGGIFCLLTLTERMLPGTWAGLRKIDVVSWALVALGALLTGLGLRSGRSQLAVTRYRPMPWGLPEWITAGCGAGALALVIVAIATGWIPSAQLTTVALAWPELHPLMIVVALLAAAPAVLTPIPPGRALDRDLSPRTESA